jgi:Flp pilus assembly pilin Flp
MSRLHTRSEQGQTMAEYGVVLAVITSTVIGALLLFSDGIRAGFERAVALLS